MLETFYTVTLKTDLVVTADAATLGGHTGLDYLPGSLFMGAAIEQAMKNGQPFDPVLFLTGTLRFLDGLPFIDGERTFPVPMSFYRPKNMPWEGAPPIILGGESTSIGNVQPQQLRKGFMTASGVIQEPKLDYRIKTAVDRDQSRSAEGQLFGYQSIPAGSIFCMAIQAENEEALHQADGWFNGKTIHLGRSRSAEYGLVGVEQVKPKKQVPLCAPAEGIVRFHLMSDLVLLHDGAPSLTPRAEDFSLSGATFLPSRSFMRFRRFSPWNRFFNCRMTERQAICKGSVIAFTAPPSIDIQSVQQNLWTGIGLFREEGFGQVQVNPPWLSKPPSLSRHIPTGTVAPARPNTPLIRYLEEKIKEATLTDEAYKTGLTWADEWVKLSNRIANNDDQKVPGKTQWSNIREIAVQCKFSPSELVKKLECYCTEDLRRKLWDAEPSLWDAIAEKVGAKPRLLESLALYHAAVEVGRCISKSRSGQVHKGSKEH